MRRLSRCLALINAPVLLIFLFLLITQEPGFNLEVRTLSDLASTLPGVTGKFGNLFSIGLLLFTISEGVFLIGCYQSLPTTKLKTSFWLFYLAIAAILFCSVVSVERAENIHLIVAVIGFLSALAGAFFFSIEVYAKHQAFGSIFFLIFLLAFINLLYGVLASGRNPPAIYEINFLLGVALWNWFLLVLIKTKFVS